MYEKHNDSIVRGDSESEHFSIFHFKNKKVIAVEAINDNKSFVIGKKIIEKKLEVPKNIIQNREKNIKDYIRDK